MPDYVERIAWNESLLVTDARMLIKQGFHARSSAFVEISGPERMYIEWENYARLRDAGRDVTLTNGNNTKTVKIPWGLQFYECSDITWTGNGIVYAGQGMDQSGQDYFTSSNYQSRRSVLSFVKCKRIKLRTYLDGSPGAGLDAEKVFPTEENVDELLATQARNYLISFVDCDDVEIELLGCGTKTDREQIAVFNTRNFRFKAVDYSSQTSEKWNSLAKFIKVENGVIGPIQGKTVSSSSLIDVIGKNIVVRDITMDFPGKTVDVSHEWGKMNSPSDNIIIENCSNNVGYVMTSVVNDDVADRLANPITNVTVSNCTGRVRVGVIRNAKFINHKMLNQSSAEVAPYGPAEGRFDFIGCTFLYEGSAAGDRAFYTANINRFIACGFINKSTNTDPLTFPKSADGAASAKTEFHGCNFTKPMTLQFGVNADFFGVDLGVSPNNVTISKVGSPTPTVRQFTPAPTSL